MDGVRRMKEGGEWRSVAMGVEEGGGGWGDAAAQGGGGGGQRHVSYTHPGGIVID